jgi:hypothetical protein
MLIRFLRITSILLATATMGLALAHAIGSPGRMELPPVVYAALQRALVELPTRILAILEPAAVGCAAVLALLVRHRRRAFVWTSAGTALLVAGLVWSLFVVTPVTAQAAIAAEHAPLGLPAFWARLRDRWEYGHVAHLALLFGAVFALLDASVGHAADTPSPAVARS